MKSAKPIKIVVFLFRHLGDVLLSTPFFSVLRYAFPDAYIEAVVPLEAIDLLRTHPAISNVRGFKKKKGLQRIREEISLYTSVYNEFDIAFNLTEGDRGALLSYISGASIRVGWDPRNSGMIGKKKLYTHLIEHCPNPKHTVEKYLDALRVLKITPPASLRDVVLCIPEKYELEIRSQIPQEPFVVMHPGSRWKFKMLPTATLEEVVAFCTSKGLHVVYTGSSDPEEISCIETMQKKCGGISLAGKLSLLELGAVIKRSAFVITPDSLTLHITSATKTPVITYFGPTSEKNWGPWRNQNTEVVTLDRPCRPCYRPGCGGSGLSDCLQMMESKKITSAIERILITIGLHQITNASPK